MTGKLSKLKIRKSRKMTDWRLSTMTLTTLEDLTVLFRPLEKSELEKAERLLEVVEDEIAARASERGRDIYSMIDSGDLALSVFKSVVCDVTGRCLNTSTKGDPLSQFAQSARGYSASGTYLVPGGGVFLKNSELRRLGIRRQRIGAREIYG